MGEQKSSTIQRAACEQTPSTASLNRPSGASFVPIDDTKAGDPQHLQCRIDCSSWCEILLYFSIRTMLLLGSDLVKHRKTPNCQADHLIPIQILALAVYLGKIKC